jgi:hypothetical protein
MAKVINSANSSTAISSISYSINDDGLVQLIFGATYAGNYERATFGEFRDCVENDIMNFIRSEDSSNHFAGSSS